MIYDEPRYTKLRNSIEVKLKRIDVLTSDFDNLTEDQEKALEEIGKQIKKIKGQVWDENNYEDAKEMWEMEIKNSDLYDVIQYLE